MKPRSGNLLFGSYNRSTAATLRRASSIILLTVKFYPRSCANPFFWFSFEDPHRFVDNFFMVIALLTDFGTADYFVGSMKGAILTVNPSAAIVDITHEIPKHDIRSAAFMLAACNRDFPAGTVFVAVVDPGVGSARRAIAVEAHGQRFVAPDNGVLSRVLARTERSSAYEIVNPKYLGQRCSTTFHGRDIFAPAAAHISLGVPLSELGPPAAGLTAIDIEGPRCVPNREIGAKIIHIDHFGNLITDLTSDDIPPNFRLVLNGFEITSRMASYADGPAGELFVIEGSAGYMEISAFAVSAAEMTGAAVGQSLILKL
jgi:S-adenosylmethionine hydrolase